LLLDQVTEPAKQEAVLAPAASEAAVGFGSQAVLPVFPYFGAARVKVDSQVNVRQLFVLYGGGQAGPDEQGERVGAAFQYADQDTGLMACLQHQFVRDLTQVSQQAANKNIVVFEQLHEVVEAGMTAAYWHFVRSLA